MLTCEPIMMLSEDVNLIDGIIEKRHNDSGKNIFDRENRRELIAERKEVIHEIMCEWKENKGV